MYSQDNETYFEGYEEFKNPLSAELYQTYQMILSERMDYLDQNPGIEEDSQLDDFTQRYEEAVEAFLENFVKKGLTIRGRQRLWATPDSDSKTCATSSTSSPLTIRASSTGAPRASSRS